MPANAIEASPRLSRQPITGWVALAVALTGLSLAPPAFAEGPEVTILRGSSAPPEPVPPPAPPQPMIVEYRYLPAPPTYPVYYAPLLPVVVVHRHR
jgi:hypothetical protein